MPTPLHPNSKCCTKLLLDADVAALYVDHSSEHINVEMTKDGFLEETGSARTAIDAPRTISIVVDVRSTDSGVLLHHGSSPAAYGYSINLSGGLIRCSEAGALHVSASVPGLVAAARRVVIHWAQRRDGINIHSELMIYNAVSNEYVFATASHAEVVPTATHTLTVGASFGGASPYTGEITAFHCVRIGQRFISTTEAVNDFVAYSTPPTLTGPSRTPILTGASDDLRIASEGNFAGPSMLLASAATRQASHRLVGSFVNIEPRDPATETLFRIPKQWYRITPDGVPGWYWCLRYIGHGELSSQVNYAHVRAHIRVFTSGGGPVCSPVNFRVFSFAHLPTGQFNEPKMVFNRSEIETISAPNGSLGQWLDFNVRLAREPTGLSYLVLAVKFDQTKEEGDDYLTGWKLNALTADPYSKDQFGGLGGDLDLGGL